MDPIIPAFAVTAAVFASYKYVLRRFLYLQRIKNIAALSLAQVKVSSWRSGGFVLQGRTGPLQVLIAGSTISRSIQVRVLIPGPPDFSEVIIRRENQAHRKTREIESGSESFDRIFSVAGPVPCALALLDAKARSLLIRANEAIPGTGSRLELAGGELTAEIGYDQLPLLLPLLLKVSNQLAHPVDIEWRLGQNATRDPEAGVRLQNLLLLIRELPGDPETLNVLHTACSDKSPQVRLSAGKALGAEGRNVLVKLAEDLEDDTASAEAISLLDLPSESTQAILLEALRRRCLQTARACLEALGRNGDGPAVDALVRVMEHEQEELSVFAAGVLGTVDNPAAEAPLTLALQRDPADLRVAAANALGRIGSTAAVLPLKEVAKHSWLAPELSRAARQAIAEIQSRLPGASPGQLSMAGTEAGQLSLAQAQAGQLSIAADPAGQLSLSEEGTPKDA